MLRDRSGDRARSQFETLGAFGLIQIFIILIAWLPHAQANETSTGAPAAGPAAASAPAPARAESIQECLDRMKKTDWESRQRQGLTSQSRGPSPISYRKVEPAALPKQCEEGDLSALKKTFENQLAGCDRAPESYAEADVRKSCEETPVPGWCSNPEARTRMVNRRRRTLAERYNSETKKQIGCRMVARREWCGETNRRMLELADDADDYASFAAKVRASFEWFRNDGRLEADRDGKFQKGDMQFTGYYAPPSIEASLTKTDEYKYPIYRKPPNLIQLAKDDSRSCGDDPITGTKIRFCLKNDDGSLSPVPERKEIDTEKALKGKRLVLAYVKNPVDVAFLMVQGSGSMRVRTPEGMKTIRLNYDGQNGRSRFMLGRILRCDGAPKVAYSSEKGIRDYLATHHDRLRTLLNFDQSYIFFKPGLTGPFGNDNIPITPRHSLATDTSVIPTGTVTMFNTTRPGGPAGECKDVSSMAVAQDTGGAIIGAHVDWYQGEGTEAQQLAGSMNFAGSLFIALPKGAGTPIEGCP